ncbi:HD domain-containing phosphohydrolase [Blastococcus deserti]|uniref:HD domain-containing phosphohydrolase n=1 Tax=Blastococcus deserti TaxID=2259033 RepID=A0ABW4X5E3_9ACTN
MAEVRPATRDSVRLSELMAAWSVAIDVGMVMPMGSGLRICSRAVRLSQRMQLDVATQRRIYYLALLRHIGCTAEGSALAGYLGDERAFRAGIGTRDVSDGRALFRYLVQLTVGSRPLTEQPAALIHLLARAGVMKQAGAAVCEVARMLIDRLGFEPGLRDGLREDVGMVYERPDRRGFPNRLGADEISLPAQLVQLSEAVSVHLRLVGPDGATEMLRTRRGRAYLPAVVDAFLGDAGPLTTDPDDPWTEVLAMEPGGTPVLGPEGVDDVLTAIADFTDLKSAYTAGHSRAVASLAGDAGLRCGLRGPEATDLRRAGWIHDVGRIAVSVPVWDKRGPLDHDQREQVRLHPYVTERIFARSSLLQPLAVLAGQHHERLDGSGYHRAQHGAALSVPARILAAADVYAALVADRAHRPASAAAAAATTLRAESRAGRLDADAVDAVLASAGHPARRRPALVSGLTAREAEVLRLLAQGASNPEIAATLVVSRKTVEHHVEAVYAKLGVHSRSAATLRAVQHGLLVPDAPRT